MAKKEFIKWANEWNADFRKYGDPEIPLPLMAEIANMTPDQRQQIGSLFCQHCGALEEASDTRGCQCCNDE